MVPITPQEVLANSEVLQRREQVAVIGAGTIGASWAALFLAHGLAVRVTDPAPGTEERVQATLDQLGPILAALGLPGEGLGERLAFFGDVEEAVEGADVVQENGPESIAFKRELWAKVEQAASPAALLASSTSGMRASSMAKAMADPSRLVVGHPFNPPHLVPLIEVVPGELTAPAVVEEAVAFYAALGKRPLVIRKEIPGFVANRLQSALFQECVHLVAQGVVSMEDLDAVVTNSIGLRWAAAGPFLTFHLGGGPGGLPHFLTHLGPGMQGMWGVLGHPRLDEPTVALLSEEVSRAYGNTSIEELERRRDQMQVAIIEALTSTAPPDQDQP